MLFKDKRLSGAGEISMEQGNNEWRGIKFWERKREFFKYHFFFLCYLCLLSLSVGVPDKEDF